MRSARLGNVGRHDSLAVVVCQQLVEKDMPYAQELFATN